MKELLFTIFLLLLAGCTSPPFGADSQILKSVDGFDVKEKSYTLNSDKEKFVGDIIIGEEGSAEFKPEMTIKNKKVEAKIKYVDGVGGVQSIDGDKIKWAKGNMELIYYDKGIDETKKKGQINDIAWQRFEQEIVLNKKPKTNRWYFDLESDKELIYSINDYGQLNVYSEEIVYPVYYDQEDINRIIAEDRQTEFVLSNLIYVIEPVVAFDDGGATTSGTLLIKDSQLIVEVASVWLQSAKYPVIIDPTYTIDSSGLNSGSLNYNDVGNITRQSDGTLWVAYLQIPTTGNEVYVSSSTDDGVTWSPALSVIGISASYDCYGYSQIMVDSNDYLHVMAVCNSGGYYRSWYASSTTVGEWDSELVDSTAVNSAYQLSAAIDSNDDIYAVSNGSVSCAKGALGAWEYDQSAYSWSSRTTLLCDSTHHQEHPSIDVKDNDEVWGVWIKGDTAYGGAYLYYDGSWNLGSRLSSAANNGVNSAINASNNVIIGWRLNNGLSDEAKCAQSDDSWTLRDFINTADEYYWGSFSSYGDVFVGAFENNTGQNEVYIATGTCATHGSPTIISSGGNANGSPSLIGKNWPQNSEDESITTPLTGYAGVYHDNDTALIYFASDDLTWNTEAAPVSDVRKKADNFLLL